MSVATFLYPLTISEVVSLLYSCFCWTPSSWNITIVFNLLHISCDLILDSFLEQLKKRGIQMASRCPLCGRNEENLDHLLLHCHSVWSLLGGGGRIISIPGLSWACPRSAKEFLKGWSYPTIRKMAAPLCLFWAIWRERNRIVFDNVDFSFSRLKTSFISRFVYWANCLELGKCSLVRILMCIL